MRKKWLIVALAVEFVSTTLGSIWATQFAATSLGFQKALGDATRLAGLHLYAPFSWLTWVYEFGPYAPAVFRVVQVIGWSSILGPSVPILLAIAVMARRRPASTAHGSATWGTTADLKKAGMLEGEGVVLCQTNDARYLAGPKPGTYRLARPGRLITHDGPEHVIVFAPTRSGKGIGTVIPTLLSWRHSALIYDIKKELWTRTAGWRRQFSRCWRFEPTAADSVRFNPLLEVRRGTSEVRDVQNIADILVDPDGSERRDHWKMSAHTLLSCAILHVLYVGPERSLAAVARLLSNPALPVYETLQRMLVTHHLQTGPHPLVVQYAREMLDKFDSELSGVVSTAKTCINLYNDPLIERSTSTSDFRISDLMNAENPISLYLVVPPSDIDRTRPLIRLLLNQVGRRLTERMEVGDKPAYRHRLLFLLDEFPSLGKLSFFETQLAYLAGYGIKAFLIAQSLNQLLAAYGQNNSILDNCHVRLTYTANDEKTAKRVSDLIGTATHTKMQKSFSGGAFFPNVNRSEQEHGRPLLTPDEILRLPYEDALLFVGGMAPYLARKLMHYTDARFTGRTDRPTPDSEAQRRGELLPNRELSDWEQPQARPSPPVVESSASDGGGLPSKWASEYQPTGVGSLGAASGEPDPDGELVGRGAFVALYDAGAESSAGRLTDADTPAAPAMAGDDEIPL